MAFIKAHGAGIRTYVPRGGGNGTRRLWLTVGEFIDTRAPRFSRSSARDTRCLQGRTSHLVNPCYDVLPDPLNCNDCTEHSAASGRSTRRLPVAFYAHVRSIHDETRYPSLERREGEYLVSRGRSERKRRGSKEGEKAQTYVPRNTI